MDLNANIVPDRTVQPRRARSRSLYAIAQAVVAHRRMPVTDRILATLLAGIAGAVNAGGFLVVGRYTSHMTGYLSQAADNLVTGNLEVVLTSVVAIFSFIFGAAISSLLVIWARQHRYHFQYALPIMVQGSALFVFAFSGYFVGNISLLLQLAGLCFLMGMQNATVTKLSKARVRTTHATGMVTDIGIEIGRGIFKFLSPNSNIQIDKQKLSILLRLVLSYVVGGILGAEGFAKFGFVFALPLALILLSISLPTLISAKPKT